MSCVVTETTKTRGGDSSIGLTDRSGKRTFQVEYDPTTPPENLVEVETADTGTGGLKIPPLRQGLPGDSTRIAKKISVKPRSDGAGLLFDVDVSYEKLALHEGEEIADPLARPDVVSFDGSSEKTPFFLSEDDPPKPVTNSAGEPFAELQDRDTGIFKLVIEGNRASINPALYASYLYPANAVNNAAVTVRGLLLGEGQARIVGISANEQTENEVKFLRVRWEVAVATTWDLELEDRGYHELDKTPGGGLAEIVKGSPPVKVETPYPLDGNGRKMGSATDTPAALTFQRYPKKDFGAFNWTAA